MQIQQPGRSLPSTRPGFGMMPSSQAPTPTQFSGNISSGVQQLSPNRSLIMNQRSTLSQKTVGDKRPLGFGASQSPQSHSLGLSSRGFGQTQGLMGSLHGAYGIELPPTLDPSEFPSLTNRGQEGIGGGGLPGRSNYVGVMKNPSGEQNEFTMSNEDFPALPGTQNKETEGSSTGDKSVQPIGSGSAVGSGRPNGLSAIESSSSDSRGQSSKKGLQTSPDGKVTNIPARMVGDQFGMVGLLTFIRVAETDPNLVALALGSDLTTLGLNLNSPENLYPNFGGPWAETPCRPQDIDYHVPPEYLTNSFIREKLAPIKLNRYQEDLLFYVFYTYFGDALQLAAAAELYSRDWRYHREERVWITRAPGMVPVEKTNSYERGTYFFWDPQNWRKVAKEFHVDYDKLEERPHLPATMF
ncbi:CCR4-NOT transcription complex subunit 2-like [Artemia franciscana]|uniref:CCR4-NOT transcription complex subunit 2 n=3 Tax=Artemia franciscana TaxID=6661 RepID=A0AA88IBI8_ARTSF|nr:hypothetical protein QYM36_005972 [Artemia franciscana]